LPVEALDLVGGDVPVKTLVDEVALMLVIARLEAPHITDAGMDEHKHEDP